MKEAVILAGGEGKRLRPYTNLKSKPMVEIGGKPILEHILDLLSDELGVENYYISTNHRNQREVSDYFGNGKERGFSVKYFRDDRDYQDDEGKIAAILRSKKHVKSDYFILAMGDTLFSRNFLREKASRFQEDKDTVYLKQHREGKNSVEMFGNEILGIRRIRDNSRSYSLRVSKTMYTFSNKVYDIIRKFEPSNMNDIINAFAKENGINGIFHYNWDKNINTVEDLREAEQWLKEHPNFFESFSN